MLDTLQSVLGQAFNILANLAEAARNVAQEAGSAPLPPSLVLGGGVLPMTDSEDRGVVETAIAAGADMLVTGNMKDIAPGPRRTSMPKLRARSRARPTCCLSTPPNRRTAWLSPRLAANAWLIDGTPPPPGILDRFMP